MKAGLLLNFQNYRNQVSDAQSVTEELRIAELAEPLGFDSVWCVEHHFTDYAACPDNTQMLAWLAGRTKRIELGTGAVIVPWNDPLRVAEKMAFLDHVSQGRARLGLGRGLSRIEYDGLGVDMNESRLRFDEGAKMIIEALERGFIEGDGPFYAQSRVEIRPRPLAGFRDRLYCVGMSPESVVQAARLGARLMTFSSQPWDIWQAGDFSRYRDTYQAEHHAAPAPPLIGDQCFCHPDSSIAADRALEYMGNCFRRLSEHYEIGADHLKQTKGYEHHAETGELSKQFSDDAKARGYCDVQLFGTPDEILGKLQARRELLGDFELALSVRFGGLPMNQIEESLRLFARDVLPEIQSW